MARSSSTGWLWLAVAGAWLVACGHPVQPADSGALDDDDGGAADSGSVDAGLDDAGEQDSGVDSGLDDGGRDGGGFDAGPLPFDTVIVTSPLGTITSTSATITFAATEAGASFACAFDSRVYVACVSPWDMTGLVSGQHLFSVRATSVDGIVDPTPAEARFNVAPPGLTHLRVMASNLTSGNLQSYDPGEGLRLIASVHPDVVLMQEFNCSSLRSCVDLATGPQFDYVREAGPMIRIPNGIISRFPILASGQWDDPYATDREFSWARLDVPGPDDLYVVSVHLATTAATHTLQGPALVEFINSNVPAGAYLVVGGDFNTSNRVEALVATLGQVLMVDAGYPVDQNGNGNTSAPRSKPLDWVLASPSLQLRATATVVGTSTWAKGLVLDTRVYTPLSDLPGLDGGESSAVNMQHMGVVRDFLIPN